MYARTLCFTLVKVERNEESSKIEKILLLTKGIAYHKNLIWKYLFIEEVQIVRLFVLQNIHSGIHF